MEADKTHKKHRGRLFKAVKWTLISIGIAVVLCVAALFGITWWLTPDRLTRIINEEASESLNADVRASNVRFTLWSHWPHLMLEADSIYVRSRNFDSILPALTRKLPADADFLLSTGHLRGGVNLLKLLSHRYDLRNVEVDSLRLNLVALTDSLNNFDIVPQTSPHHSVPPFHIDGMKINGRGIISYNSIPSSTLSQITLDDATLTPLKGKNNYALMLKGDMTVKSGNLTTFKQFPFELAGDVHLRFKPFGVSTDNYRVALGKVNGRMDLSMQLGEEDNTGLRINNLAYHLDDVSLTDLLQSIPGLDAPFLRRLKADIDLDCTARLATPYDFSSAWLPSAVIDFSVPKGHVSYTLADGRSYSASEVTLDGHLLYDGRNPDKSYIEIPRMEISCLGATLRMSARIDDLTTSPRGSLQLEGDASLAQAAREINALRPYRPQGEVDFQGSMQFFMHDGALYGSLPGLRISSPSLSIHEDGYTYKVRNLEASTKELNSEMITAQSLTNEIPIDLHVRADVLTAERREGKSSTALSVHVANLAADGRMSRHGNGAVLRNFDITFTGDTVNMRSGEDLLAIDDASMRLRASRMKSPQVSKEYVQPAEWSADKRTLDFAPHTSEFVTMKAPESLRRYMRNWRTRLDIAVRHADYSTPSYHARNTLDNLALTASFDSLLLRHVAVASGNTKARLSGHVRNLRQFINSPVPAPLYVYLDLDLDTLHMNQLARAYTSAHPHSAIAVDNKKAMAAGADTVAHIIPRNLMSHLHVTADETEYMNLRLYNLNGDLVTANGLASIDTLHLGSDFGEASLKLAYDSRNLQNLNISTSIELSDIDVVRFFQNFHSLLVMWPEMSNLSGMLSASLDGNLLMFPDMYLNVPSLSAQAHVLGWDLVLKQNHFIRSVTRKLLIPTSNPLHIHDMDLHAAVHGNLLEIFPFTFEVCDYKLQLQGLNNFDGDLFYHIGVERWPFHIPFGLNVKGKYHDPKIRFGSRDWHDRNAIGITAGIEDYDRLNILSEVRKYMGEFVHAAATYNK